MPRGKDDAERGVTMPRGEGRCRGGKDDAKGGRTMPRWKDDAEREGRCREGGTMPRSERGPERSIIKGKKVVVVVVCWKRGLKGV